MGHVERGTNPTYLPHFAEQNNIITVLQNGANESF